MGRPKFKPLVLLSANMNKPPVDRFDVPRPFDADNARSLLVAATLRGGDCLVFFNADGNQYTKTFPSDKLDTLDLRAVVSFVNDTGAPAWTWGRTPGNLASRKPKFTFMDETDKWDTSGFNERSIFDQPDFFKRNASY